MLVEDCLFIWRLAAPAQKTLVLTLLTLSRTLKSILNSAERWMHQSDFVVQQNLGQGWWECQDWLCPCPDLIVVCVKGMVWSFVQDLS